MDERGQILAVVALSMLVLLLFAAFVIDVGNWYSHKRQLQNRADAGALAAGVEYEKSWTSCGVGNATETAIANQAHAFAGDPNPTTPVVPVVNTETADQTKLNVFVNSTSYDADVSDGGGPCFKHAPDDISPLGGYWTDVRVKERDLASFFGSIGLPLGRNIARARVALHPSVSEAGFVPLAIPDNRIVQAQARLFNGCTGAQIGSAIPLAPLDSTVAGNPSVSGATLWVPDTRSPTPNPATPVPAPSAFPLALPGSAVGTGCGGTGNNGQDYVPVEVQVRVAGSPNVNLDQSCAALQSASLADCFDDLTEIRAYTGGLVAQRPVVGDVTLGGTGAAPCSQDAYYARLQAGKANCAFTATATIDFDTRIGNQNTFSAVVHVAGSNTDYPLTALTPKPASGKWVSQWTSTAVPLSSIGARDITVDWAWNGPSSGTWTPTGGAPVLCKSGGNNPCDQSGTLIVHRASLGDDPNGAASPTADVVALAEITGGPNLSTQLASTQATGMTISPYLFVGLRSTLTTGQFAILREGDAQGNQSLVCDPDYTNGDTYTMFKDGCKPPYTANDFSTGFWWPAGQNHCPAQVNWFKQPVGGSYGLAPWECIPTEPGGHGNQVTDGLAVRMGNCQNPLNNGCQAHKYVCNTPISYPVFDPADPRIIRVYIVPYGSLKNTSGNDEIPVLDFAAFYVTAYSSGNDKEPCSANDNAKLPGGSTAVVGGYFLRFVEPSGSFNPNAICDPNAIRPCRAVLVR